jgi:hypothetical protein
MSHLPALLMVTVDQGWPRNATKIAEDQCFVHPFGLVSEAFMRYPLVEPRKP